MQIHLSSVVVFSCVPWFSCCTVLQLNAERLCSDRLTGHSKPCQKKCIARLKCKSMSHCCFIIWTVFTIQAAQLLPILWVAHLLNTWANISQSSMWFCFTVLNLFIILICCFTALLLFCCRRQKVSPWHICGSKISSASSSSSLCWRFWNCFDHSWSYCKRNMTNKI